MNQIDLAHRVAIDLYLDHTMRLGIEGFGDRSQGMAAQARSGISISCGKLE